MSMVVECESCRSRFHLNVSLLKESKAVRFRCRKCGGFIMVRNPYAPPDIPVPSVSVKIDSPSASDISSAVQPEIVEPSPREIPDPSTTVHRREGVVHFSPEKGFVPLKPSIRPKPSPGRNILVVGLPILLFAGCILYLGITATGQELLGRWFSSWGAVPQTSAPARPAYEVREMKSTVHKQAAAGNLFVVSGTVVNVGKGPSRGIELRATLFGEDTKVLMENSSTAGNLIDEPTLRHMNRNPIEAGLKTEHREGGEHRDILPGESLPFMVVFFDPPGKITSYTVRAVEAMDFP